MRKIRSGQSFLYREQGYNSTIIEVNMNDIIHGELLQAALEKTTERFPYMMDKLVEKESSYYLCPNNSVPMQVAKTTNFRSLGSKEVGYHLLDVTFIDNSIRVAFHHAFCDGRGVKPFVETLVYYYCCLKYEKVFSCEGIHIVEEVPDASEVMEPFGSQPFDVNENDIRSVDRDGFSLPESTISPKGCYRTSIMVNQAEFVSFAKAHKATPSILTAILVSSSIHQIHPEADKSIICNLAIDFRPALSMKNVHKNCTGIIYLSYSKADSKREIPNLASTYRALLSDQRNANAVKASVNSQIALFNRVDQAKTMKEKQELLSFINNTCLNSYVISYLGQMNFNDFGKHVNSAHLYSGEIKGLTVNMVAAGDTISFDFIHGFENNEYTKGFLENLDNIGINYTSTETCPISTGIDASYLMASQQLE
ncbi:hypothetical protein [uncultured Enterococcus sp.]|uniref:hypothetical protein n=1 Tax=uncultured Enterococcus sp. TaxID=167972 RepID=UPI002AA78ADA|nr:hypothetical protein [uncultured Enterococcus sp.]